MCKWDAYDYQQHSQAQLKLGLELLGKLNLRGGERILDIGCGDGRLTAAIAGLAPRVSVLGIDSSEEMISLAQQAFPASGHSGLDFALIDARELSFRGEFDIVFSNAALHWIIDHSPVLEGIRRSLKAGGRTLLQMGGRGNVAELYSAALHVIGHSQWSHYFRGFSMPWGFHGEDEYERWLAEAGLRPVRVELIRRDMVQSGREGLLAWMRTTWLPFTQRLPEELRGEFLGQIANEYLVSHPPDEDGQVHVGMMRLEVEAVKHEL